MVRTKITKLLSGETLRARATRGTILAVINLGGQNVIRLGSNLILTRLLFPEAFGLMALVQVVLTGLKFLSEIGIRDASIHYEDGGDPTFLNTAWTINIMRGFILWFVTILLATPMAEFYDAPQLAQILPVIGLTMVLAGLSSPRILFADRNMMIGRLTAMLLGSQVLGILVMIFLAWWLESVWALVIGWIVQILAESVLSHLVLKGAPARMAFDPAIARRIIGFGKYIFLATVAGFVVAQADRAVLGKFISLDKLAIYNIGLTLAFVPMTLTHALSTRILFPIYARKSPLDDPESRRKINLARRLITGGILVGTMILALIGIELIEIMYDDRYEAAGPIVVLVSLSLIPGIVTFSYHRLLLAAGHSGRFAVLTVSLALLQLGVLIVGVQFFGIGGAAVAPGLAGLIFYPALVAMILRYRGWDPLHDGFYFAVGLILTCVVIWRDGDRIWPLFSPL